VTLEPLDDLSARGARQRLAADRIYNDALTALDRAATTPPVLPAIPAAADRTRLATVNDRAPILPAGAPAIDRSLKGRLAGFIWRLVGPPLQRQAEFNAAVAEHLNRSADAHERWSEAAARLREAVQAELQAVARFQSLLLQYLQTVTAYVDTKDRGIGGVEIRDRLARLEQRVQAMKRELEPRSREADRPDHAAVFSGAVDAATYVGFEDRFRGASPEIARRVEEYLPILEQTSNVVDIGCGRGELLAALRARGIQARGVDSNAAMVAVCRSQQLEVEQGDALSYLDRQADGSVGALTAIQVVEHFEPAYLGRFLETAFHKMSVGAPLVLETINAACWMAFFETYLRDLTHQRPLHPDTLRYLVEASGFSSVDVRFRQPITAGDRLESVEIGLLAGSPAAVNVVASAVNDHAQKLNTRLFSSMDYAIVARR
jgi:O-antigen chain-terminating methyltransferase